MTPARTNQNTVASYLAYVAQQSADNARLHVRARRAALLPLALFLPAYAVTFTSPEIVREVAGAVLGAWFGIPAGIALATLSDFRAARAARRK